MRKFHSSQILIFVNESTVTKSLNKEHMKMKLITVASALLNIYTR